VSLAEQFNEYDVSFNLTEEGITLEAWEGDEEANEFVKFEEEVLEKCKAYADYAPGDSRAGLVVWVRHKNSLVWYDENSECAWIDD